MNALMDQLLVIAAVTSAVGYFVWHNFRSKRGDGPGCGGGCDCGAKKAPRLPAKKA